MAMPTNRAGWVALVIASVSVALATTAYLLPINEYRAIGVDAWDCDGPFGVGVFAAAALITALFAAALGVRAQTIRRNWALMMLLSTTLLLLGITLPHWWVEMERNEQTGSPCVVKPEDHSR